MLLMQLRARSVVRSEDRRLASPRMRNGRRSVMLQIAVELFMKNGSGLLSVTQLCIFRSYVSICGSFPFVNQYS